MEFRKENRSCQTPRGFRLATVEEATQNFERIKHLLNTWDKVRLLDGWLSAGADGEIRGPEVGFRHGLGYMLITRPAPEISADGSAQGVEGYGEVAVNEEGKQSALLLCAEDLNYEVVDWLLNFAWSNVNNRNADTQVEMEITPIKEFSEAVSGFAREISNGNARASKTEEREQTMREAAFQMIKNVLDGEYCMKLMRFLVSSDDVKDKFDQVASSRGDTKSWDNDVLWNAITPLLSHKVVFKSTNHFLGNAKYTDKFDGLQVALSALYYVNSFIDETLLSEIKVIKQIDDGVWKAFRREKDFDGAERYAMLGCNVRNYILRLAAKEGDAQVVQKLLDCGAEPFETDGQKKTALHYCVGKEGKEKKLLDVAEILLKTCRNKEELLGASDADGLTALHTASSSDYPFLCELLLRHGSEMSAKDQSGRIPLHHAVRKENEEVVKVFITREMCNSPVINTSIVDSEDDEGNTPLGMTAAQNNVEMFGMLLLRSKRPKAYFHKMDIGNVLRQSACKGYVNLVDKLMENGVNPLDRDGDGKTTLHYFAECDKEISDSFTIFERYARNLELTKVVDKNGRTVLHVAASRGHAGLCARLLRDYSGLYMCKDRDGQTPLHYAVKQNNEAVVNTLLEESSEKDTHKVDLRDLSGTTPLHMASAQGNLALAARICHIQIRKKLLESGSQPLQERDCDGKTALHYVVQAKKRDDAAAIAALLVGKCRSDEEKILLLWASAAGIRTIEESLGSQTFDNDNDPVKAGTQCNLVRTAAKLGYIDMTLEFLTRGGDIADLRNPSWKNCLPEEEKENVDRVVKQINKRTEQASEQPTLSDDLERNDYAIGLAAFFLNPYVKSPITVGISGEWGMGKSSMMIQTEIILLKTAAQLAFPNLLEIHKKFPGAKNLNLTKEGQKKCHDIRRSLEALLSKDQESKANLIIRVFTKIRRWARHLFGTEDKTKDKINPLFDFLEKYECKYHAIYKSLALVGGSNMIERNEEKSDLNNEGSVDVAVPAILTVRYNAWEYRNESEAWAGLAVKITKEMEETMTLEQWLSTCWRKHKRSIWVAMILPCLLAAILAGCITWLAWMLLERSKQKGLEELKYGSLAATVVVIVWTVVKSIMAVLKPVSAQIADYISLPDHTEKLGYHQQVSEDINFLREEIGKQPYWLCTIIAFLWCWTRLDWSPNNVGNTAFPKMRPQFKGNLRIIVLVDDLDRCQESVILQVLTAINLVLSVCKIDVIVGMEKKMIDRAIIKKYGDKSNNKSKKSNEELGDKFFQKIIQLPLDLPDPSDIESKRFLEGQLGSLDGDFETKENSESSSGRPSINSGGKTSTSHQGRQGVKEREQSSAPGLAESKETAINVPENEADQVTMATSSRRLPREWKRMLHYHRLAWNIFSKTKEAKSLAGWQVQLVAWIFVCWQWKDQINTIIQAWHKLDVICEWKYYVEDWPQFKKGPSLREIVDRCMEEQQAKNVKRATKDGSGQYEETKTKLLNEEKEDMNKGYEKYKRKISKVAHEEEDWKRLSETLRRFNVSMEGMQAFQRFRFYCNPGYLPWPTPNIESTYEWEYDKGRRPHLIV
eukprot:Gb_07742 [translate_table: standard]